MAEKSLFLELHGAISELQDKYQDVIVLHYFERKSIAEMSKILDQRPGSLKSLLHRGRNQLRARLQSSYIKLVE